LAGISSDIRSYTAYIYTVLANPTHMNACTMLVYGPCRHYSQLLPLTHSPGQSLHVGTFLCGPPCTCTCCGRRPGAPRSGKRWGPRHRSGGLDPSERHPERRNHNSTRQTVLSVIVVSRGGEGGTTLLVWRPWSVRKAS